MPGKLPRFRFARPGRKVIYRAGVIAIAPERLRRVLGQVVPGQGAKYGGLCELSGGEGVVQLVAERVQSLTAAFDPGVRGPGGVRGDSRTTWNMNWGRSHPIFCSDERAFYENQSS